MKNTRDPLSGTLNGVQWTIDPLGHYLKAPTAEIIGALGYIPSMLHGSDERRIVDQLSANYIAGPLRPDMNEFSRIDEQGIYHYTGKHDHGPPDPPMPPLAFAEHRGDRLYIYPHAIVAIVDLTSNGRHGGDLTITRMD